MAESYRGLTIRIGGDTTKLTQALKAANTAISGTQQELRKIGQALKLDPTSIEAYSMQVGYLANQAANTAMKLTQLKEAQEQLAKTEIKVGVADDGEGNLEDIKESIEDIIAAEKELDGIGDKGILNVSQKVGAARSEFVQLEKTLASMHTEVTELSAQAAKVETTRLKEALNVSEGKKTIDEAKDSLTKMFKEIYGDTELSKEKLESLFKDVQGSAETLNFDKIFNLDSAKDIVNTLNQEFEKIPSHLRPGSDAVKAFAEDIVKMRDSYETVKKELEEVRKKREEALGDNGGKENTFTREYARQIVKLEQQLDESMKKIKEGYSSSMEELVTISGEVFNFKNANTDPDYIKGVLSEIAEELNIDKQKADEFASSLDDFQKRFSDADTTLKKWMVVAEFEDLIVEITKGEASLVNFSKVLSDMNVPSNLMRGMSELTTNIKVLDDAYNHLMQSGDSISSSIQVDPTNLQAVKAAMDAYSAAAMVAFEESERLQKELKNFEADGISKADDSVKSTAQSLYEAQVAAEKASQYLSDVSGRLNAYKTKYDDLGAVQEKSITNEQAVSASLKASAEEREQLEKKISEYTKKLKEAQAAEKEASSNLELAKNQNKYEELSRQVDAFRANIVAAYKAQVELAESSGAIKVFGDTSDIDEYATHLDAVLAKIKTIDELIAKDPTNGNLKAERVQAIADAGSIAGKQIEEINNAIAKMDSDKVKNLKDRFNTAGEAIVGTKKAANDLAVKIADARTKLNSLTSGSEFDGIRDDIRDTSKEIGVTLPSDVEVARNALKELERQFKAALDDVEGAKAFQVLEGLANKAEDASNKARGAGIAPNLDEAAFQQAISRVAQMAEQAAQRIVESANTIDSAYRDMRKTVEGTEEQFKSLHDQAIAFSQTHAVSADSLLEIEALGGQLGIAAGKLQSFGEAVSSVVIATDLAAEDAALKFGQLTNVMSDLDDSTFENLADVLVRLGNTTATTESQIMEVAQRMSAVANVTSMTTPQLMAWSAAIASTGVHSESAATSITRTITGIGQAVAEGGQTLQKFAQIAGMSADELKQKWETSSSEALEAFVKGLARLDDSSTDMIQALDDVGISSVRQETSLLALTQTIGNLNGAMNNATDAWTNGGDAAREAEEKSKGFSGSLSILQNNTQNFAAALGDGLVPVMNTVSSALNIITDLLNLMPGPLKTAVVSVGGLSAILGTTYPVISQINEVLKNSGVTLKTLPTLLQSAVGGYEAMKSALMGVQVAEEAAASAALAFSTALKATGIGIAITLALSLVNELVKKFQEWQEHTKLVETATTGLSEALNASTEAYKKYGESMQDAARSADEIEAANNKVLESTAALSDKMNETMSTVGENAAAVDYYAQTIAELGNQGAITGEDLKLLQNAVEQYNAITGASLEITDETTGALNLNSAAVNELTDAYKKNAEQQAYLEIYNDIIKQRATNEVELKKVETELREATSESIKRNQDGIVVFDDLNDRIKKLMSSKEELTKVNASLDDSEEAVKELIEESSTGYSTLENAIVAAGYSLDEFNSLTDDQKATLREIEAALNATGASLTDYGYLTASQLSAIVSDWDGTASSVIASLKKIQDAANQTKDEVKSANDSIVTAVKRDQEDAYNSLKRQLDDAYTARKNNLDDQYNALKNELDDEYNAVKSSLDKQYNEHKKTLDKEYDEHKKVLDKKYDARKEELDKEYDAAKEASDQYLKDLKEKLDEEVDAYKDATDEKIKEMKREYEAKKKFIEDAEDERLSDLDAQIDAIEAEQKAEDKARKKQQQQEKLEELKQAAYDAKTKKDQEKAVKAYYDYVEDLEAEYRKEQRQEAIQALKDAKENVKEEAKQRQEALKESYETATEQYKADREANLEILKKNTEKEYEQAKKGEEAKLALVKKAHETELSMLKESNEAELAMHKENNEAVLAAEKEGNDAYLNSIKRNNEAILNEKKRANEAELNQMKRNHEDQLKQLKRDQEDELKALKEGLENIGEVAEEEAKAISEGAKKILESLRDSGIITNEQFLDAMNGVPGALEEIFNDAGLATDEGTKRIASYMYRNGELTVQQYLDIMNGVPGATDELFTDAALVAAEKLGLIPGSVDEVGTKMISAADIAMKGFNEVMAAALNESVTNAANLPGNMADGITANSDKPRIAASAVMEGIGGVLKGGEDLYNSIGQKLDTDVANGIASSADQPVLAAHGMLDSVIMLFDAIGLNLEPRGELIPVGIASGVAQGAGTLSDTASAMMQNLYATLDTGENTAIIGRNLPLWYASGISETAGQPLGIVQAMMEGAYKVLDSGDNTSAYGKTIPVGYASGIAEEAGAPVEVTGKMMETLYEAMGQTDNTDTLGKNFMIGYANGIAKDADKPVKSTAETAKAMLKYMDIHESTDKVGKNAAIGFNNGFVSYANNVVIPAIRRFAQSVVSAMQNMLKIHSPSREFEWLAEMTLKGFEQGWSSEQGAVLRMADSTASALIDAMANQDFDVTGQLIDSMRSKEQELAAQSKRMADIVENGFDPRLTVDAAYEAIDRINAGELRRQQVVAAQDVQNPVMTSPTVILNVSQVIVREEADIEAIANKLALKVNRSISSRIG